MFRDGAPPDTPAAATAAMRMLLRCDGGTAGDVWLSTPGVQDMAALRCPAFFIADVDCKRGDAAQALGPEVAEQMRGVQRKVEITDNYERVERTPDLE